ncbi:MAG: carotenoid biosynthesis protein [Anaerolineae bacterium]|nr:carotenoid biosynthesis protein [Anaerolineae bacterium]
MTMILLPIVKWTWGAPMFEWGVVLSVLLQTGLVLAVVAGVWSAIQLIRVVTVIVVSTFGVEAIGTATGFPFGFYHYTSTLQPQVAHVPLLIPLAWLMMLPVVWAVAHKIVGQSSGWRFVIVSATAMTAWDLFLDPQMVAWGLWVWDQPGGYFGIPWQNFVGWFLTAVLVTLLARPPQLSHNLLVAIYVTIWILETIGLLFFWGLPGPALVGSIAMGSLIVMLWLAEKRRP